MYEDENKSMESFLRKIFGEEKKEKNKDKNRKRNYLSICTYKKYRRASSVSLFGALHPNEATTLTFEFRRKGEKLKLNSGRSEVNALYIVINKREHFLYAIPVDTDEQLQYRITFPEEGTYKIWGDFYINGKKYKRSLVYKCKNEKTAKYLAVFSFSY